MKIFTYLNYSITKFLGNINFNKLIDICLVELSKINCPVKTGTFIETRTGMINISPVSRSCNQIQRDDFDKLDIENKYRINLCCSIWICWT